MDYHLSPEACMRARNAHAYALGRQERGGFRVRRVVWGLTMARAERLDEEEIRRVLLLVEGVMSSRCRSRVAARS
jgi:hypothetical protein